MDLKVQDKRDLRSSHHKYWLKGKMISKFKSEATSPAQSKEREAAKESKETAA